tara:strand:- start:2151 stop:3515 length:1365 start_codon:yes stop_codon:yes gene_type:complete
MATTRKSIAEQVLRIVNGGDISDDSPISLREVMVLVDQERDSLIKRDIMDRTYTKSTTTATGELEITGDWLSKFNLPVVGNSYATLKTTPINLPNDVGVFRVSSSDPGYTKQQILVSVDTGVSTPNTTQEKFTIDFSVGPKILRPKYHMSLTFNDGSEDKQIDFHIDTTKYNDSFYNGVNIVNAIINNSTFQNFLDLYDLTARVINSSVSDDTGAILDIRGLYEFTISEFKIDAKESADSSHGFTYVVTNAANFSQSNVSDTSLSVTLNGTAYILSYSEEDYLSVSGADVAQNFVSKFSAKIAQEQNISVTNSSADLFFEEIEAEGGFVWDAQGLGEIELTTGTNTSADMTAKFYETRIYTRMPSGGPVNALYDRTVTSSGRRFWYIEGNSLYLYKNKEALSHVDVWLIASSASLGDTDDYPVPADYKKQIITNLVQLFRIMREAEQDMINDNI